MPAILLIDDDDKLGARLSTYFERFGLDLVSATHPDEGVRILRRQPIDLVLLDIMLPDKNGFEVCRELRVHSRVPIIMLTARGELSDRVVGLELGADDYVAKPFEPRELVARIQSVLRRAAPTSRALGSLHFGDLSIDLEQKAARLGGQIVNLTTMEYNLLELLASAPGRIFSRDDILNHLSGIDAQVFSRSVDIAVSRLRQKLHDNSKQPRFIKTMWGSGYAFVGVPK